MWRIKPLGFPEATIFIPHHLITTVETMRKKPNAPNTNVLSNMYPRCFLVHYVFEMTSTFAGASVLEYHADQTASGRCL